ncbi:metal dependent phosphohydrolase, partial [mine drainage metagenome]
VAVTGLVQVFQNHAQLKVRTLARWGWSRFPSATALLPRRRCPDIALPGSNACANWKALPDPLSGFLRNVLLDPAIGLPLLRCRASVSHHHADVGGLLMHSTGLLDQAAELTRTIIPHDAWSPHLAQLGYLLHDLGKLRTVGELRRPRHARVVPHEFVTIELLAPHLRWLEQRDLDLATALRHLFSYLATPGKSTHDPQPCRRRDRREARPAQRRQPQPKGSRLPAGRGPSRPLRRTVTPA